MEKKPNIKKRPVKIIVSTMACFVVIAGGIAGMTRMSMSGKEPAPQKTKQMEISVAAVPVVKEDISVFVTGYGQANPVNITEISPQVSGKIVGKTSLRQGETIQKGEMLLEMDATDYENQVEKALTQVKLRENEVEQLKAACSMDKGRLSAVKKNTALARSNFLRLDTLYRKDRVGTLSSVEEAEQNYNSILDTEKSLVKSIDLYPLQITEARNNLADAESDLKIARLDVERCRITAPFTGRIKDISIDIGAYITTGTQALTLADDRILEIQVPISDKDAFETLGIQDARQGTGSSLEAIECRVETITGNVCANLPASLHRIIKYDPASRTLFLAVRVLQEESGPAAPSISILEGMFCKISLKGKPIKDVVKIPASILNPDNTVYLVRDNQLKTLEVTKVMEETGHIYISGSFQSMDRIITTKLTNPIENTLVKTSLQKEPSASSAIAANTGDPQ